MLSYPLIVVIVCAQLDKHRPIVMLFFELLSHLYRVVTLVGTVKERKSIFALYTTANSMSSEPTDIVGVSECVCLLINVTVLSCELLSFLLFFYILFSLLFVLSLSPPAPCFYSTFLHKVTATSSMSSIYKLTLWVT